MLKRKYLIVKDHLTISHHLWPRLYDKVSTLDRSRQQLHRHLVCLHFLSILVFTTPLLNPLLKDRSLFLLSAFFHLMLSDWVFHHNNYSVMFSNTQEYNEFSINLKKNKMWTQWNAWICTFFQYDLNFVKLWDTLS